jgi:hypothetical protein
MLKVLAFGLAVGIGIGSWRSAPPMPGYVPQVFAGVIVAGFWLAWRAGLDRSRRQPVPAAVAVAAAEAEATAGAVAQTQVVINLQEGARHRGSVTRPGWDVLPWVEGTHGHGWSDEALDMLAEDTEWPRDGEVEGAGAGAVAPSPRPLGPVPPGFLSRLVGGEGHGGDP